jgi:putative inorganic carbon (hco3(-)) transporter
MNATAHWERRTVLRDTAWIAVLVIAGSAIALLPVDLGLAALAGCVLVLLTLIRPEYGLYALVFAVPFGSLRQIQLAGMNLDVTELCVGLVVVSWVAGMVARRRVVVPRVPLLLPLLIFSSVLVLSWLSALSLAASLKETLKWVQFTLIYVFVASTLSERSVHRTINLILVAGLAEALLGIYQFFGRIGPDGFLWPTPIGLFMRAYGTFDQPNPFGGYLGMVAPLAYALWLTSFEVPDSARRVWRFVTRSTVYAVLTVVMVVAILMTWSRGALLGFVAAFVIINVRHSRRAAIVFLAMAFLVTVLGAVQMLPSAVTQRFEDFLPFLSIPDVSVVEVNPLNFAIVQRLAHWTAGWQMFLEHPWFGVGIGNYSVVYPIYALPAWSDPLGHAHNYYLNIAAEAGLIGLAAYLLLWGSVLSWVWRAVGRVSGYGVGVALGVLGMLVHLGVHSFVDNLFVHGMYLEIAILLGCVVPLVSREPGAHGDDRRFG